ncbi:MAG TPA: MFS transporter [Candidatus Limnocylindrales bacterium]|nr:MFS transporter [Candidatus Limnocylindrales bacterium]
MPPEDPRPRGATRATYDPGVAQSAPVVATPAVRGPLGWLARVSATGDPATPFAWALYDLANTVYSYAIVSYAMGLWAVERLGPADGQLWFGLAAAASVGLNALVSPVLGAMSDRGGRRLPFLFAFTALCIASTALIALTTSPLIGLGLFAVANFAYQAALIYYDATLPIVARPDSRGRVSGFGVAVGYLGTLLIAGTILVLGSGSSPATFLLAAALYAGFSIPIFVVVREVGTGERFRLRDALAAWHQLGDSIREARTIPGLGRFLLARFFYTDPVNTVIVVMSVFAVQAIGLTAGQANLVLLSLTIVAVVASFLWGQLVERIGPKRTLGLVLGTWCVGLLAAGSVLALPTFLLGGILLGAGLGGVWTSDRVLLLRLVPLERAGQYFGLYGLVGKASAVTGPVLYGAIVATLLPRIGDAAYQVGIASFLGLIVVGYALLRGVPEGSADPRPAAAEGPAAAEAS